MGPFNIGQSFIMWDFSGVYMGGLLARSLSWHDQWCIWVILGIEPSSLTTEPLLLLFTTVLRSVSFFLQQMIASSSHEINSSVQVTQICYICFSFNIEASLFLIAVACLYNCCQSVSADHPVVGSGVIRIDQLCFRARCCKRWLNQALSVL